MISDGSANQKESKPSNDGILDPKTTEKTTKNTAEKALTDDERSLPTNENMNNPTGPMQPDKQPEKVMQDEQSSSRAVNSGASYPEDQLPPSHLEMSPAAEAIAPTASYGSDTVQVAGKETQATRSDKGKKESFFINFSVYWY